MAPAADLRRLDIVQVLTKPDANLQADATAGAVTFGTAAVGRLALIGLIGGILQLTAFSQITIFGVPADLAPLIVASIGFLSGSISGAVFGFCLGLFLDTALMQTLGVTSLVLTVVGYGSGRVRELRDPAHGLAPVAVGAVATAVRRAGLRGAAVPARRRGAAVDAARAPDPDDGRAQHAARAAGVRALPPCRCCRSCPTTRAAGAAARTRPGA